MNARVAYLAGLLVVALAIAPALAVAPTSDFNGTPLSGCSALTVAFVDMSTGTINDYNWTFGDGGTSTARNVSHTYTVSPGAGTMSYTVAHGVNATAEAGSDIETKTAYITVSGTCPQIIDPNTIDFANLSALIGNVAGIFPGIVTLVVSIVPLYITQGLLYLIIGIMAGLVAKFGSGWGR
jgi:PKD repeat protein